MDTIQTHVLLASGFLKPIASLLQDSVTKAIKKISEKIPIKDVDIVFFDQRDDFNSYAQIDTKTGLGQFAISAHVLYVAVQSDHKDIHVSLLERPLMAALSHGLYHCLR